MDCFIWNKSNCTCYQSERCLGIHVWNEAREAMFRCTCCWETFYYHQLSLKLNLFVCCICVSVFISFKIFLSTTFHSIIHLVSHLFPAYHFSILLAQSSPFTPFLYLSTVHQPPATMLITPQFFFSIIHHSAISVTLTAVPAFAVLPAFC